MAIIWPLVVVLKAIVKKLWDLKGRAFMRAVKCYARYPQIEENGKTAKR